MIDLLILLLVPALKCTDGGSRKPWHIAAAVVAYMLDLIIARTTFALVAGRGPRNGEHTVSQMLEHLSDDETHPDRELFRQIALKINRVSGFEHIKMKV